MRPVTLPALLLLLACAGAVAATPAGPPAADADASAAAAADPPAEPEDTRSRLERMRGTGSRAGFRHDTRPSGKLAQQGRRTVATREEGEVAPRPTRWRDESVGGRTVHQVRFRRQGEPDADDDRTGGER